MAVLDLLGSLFGLADKVLDKLPNYEQKKVEEYHKLKEKYLNEKRKDNRNDQLMLVLGNELCEHVNDFAAIISKSSIKGVQDS